MLHTFSTIVQNTVGLLATPLIPVPHAIHDVLWFGQVSVNFVVYSFSLYLYKLSSGEIQKNDCL